MFNTSICSDNIACVAPSSSGTNSSSSSGALSSTTTSSGSTTSTTSTTTSTSSTSSSGNGITPSCGPNGPTCPSGFNYTCPSNTTPGCNSNLPACFNGSTAVADGTCEPITPSCTNGVPTCPDGFTFSCLAGGTPSCDLLGFGLPFCALGNQLLPGSCEPTLTPDNLLSIDVAKSPEFPSVIDIPLTPDELIGKIGVAFPDSNPSYELDLKTVSKEEFANIKSIDLVDKNGTVFTPIMFLATDVPGIANKYILGIKIPKNIAIGEAKLNINLNSNRILTATLEIIESLNVRVKTIKDPNKRNIGKVSVKNVHLVKKGNEVLISLFGKNFANRQIFFIKDGENIKQINPISKDVRGNPNTSVTIFPSFLNAIFNTKRGRVVTQSNTLMRIKFSLDQELTSDTEVVIVVVTPEGIASVKLKLQPGNQNIRFRPLNEESNLYL